MRLAAGDSLGELLRSPRPSSHNLWRGPTSQGKGRQMEEGREGEGEERGGGTREGMAGERD